MLYLTLVLKPKEKRKVSLIPINLNYTFTNSTPR